MVNHRGFQLRITFEFLESNGLLSIEALSNRTLWWLKCSISALSKQRSLVGFSAWGCEESDTTEWLHFHFSLSCIGEGNGNPLQCSFLENPRDREAWWAAVHWVAQSRTRLKRLSSCSSSSHMWPLSSWMWLAYPRNWLFNLSLFKSEFQWLHVTDGYIFRTMQVHGIDLYWT